MKDKVSLEKGRIDQRVGFQARMHKQNAPATSAMLTSLNPGDAGYIANSDRFHTDTVGEFREEREHKMERQKEANQYRRIKTEMREADKHLAAEQKELNEEARFRQWREDGMKAKKNTSAVAYDITTLEYNQNTDGEMQKYQDDMVRYRAELRTNNIVAKGDTRVPYNILNGNEMVPRRVPARIEQPVGGRGNNNPYGDLTDRRRAPSSL